MEERIARLAPRLRAHLQRRMGPRVRRWIEVEDLLQRVFLEAFPALTQPGPDLDDEELLRRLMRSANTRIVDVVRRHSREVGHSGFSAPAVGRRCSSVGSVTRADQARWLRALVHRLPEPYRSTIQYCALEGRSFVEAGELLGLEPDTVRKRYNRAKQLLSAKIAARRNGPVL